MTSTATNAKLKTQGVAPSFWTDALARRLLADLTLDQQAQLAGGSASPQSLQSGLAVSQQLQFWVERARTDGQLQRAIMRHWRVCRSDIVDGVRKRGTAAWSLRMFCHELLQDLDPDEILLELVTDEEDDGWLLVAEFIEEMPRSEMRRQFESAKQALEVETAPTCEPVARVVIFGGHPRDQSELAQRLTDCGPFDLRWQALERDGREVSKLVADALRTADAAIVITCRVSHEIMYSVKRYVQNHGLRYRCIVKATDRRIRDALDEMFPELDLGSTAPSR